ncbi:NAD-dependent epimerase/dehydratase family protein [Roseibium sp. M-1]
MSLPILVTGSSGLIGAALVERLTALGQPVRGYDIACGPQDTVDAGAVNEAVQGCGGIIHLAAVSRVLWGEHNPALCRRVNVGGTRNVLAAAHSSPVRPWVLFGSSREAYGPVSVFPAGEDTERRPMNVYGRSKLAGERLVEAARETGVKAAILRFSNVYGRISDHADRVVPAFARAATEGRSLQVEGRDHVFDFNYLDDVVDGILLMAGFIEAEKTPPPPVQFVTGVGTTLTELAETSVRIAETGAEIRHVGPRSFDVNGFVGSPERARQLLGWQARTGVEEGLTRMIEAYRKAAASQLPGAMPASGGEECTGTEVTFLHA